MLFVNMCIDARVSSTVEQVPYKSDTVLMWVLTVKFNANISSRVQRADDWCSAKHSSWQGWSSIGKWVSQICFTIPCNDEQIAFVNEWFFISNVRFWQAARKHFAENFVDEWNNSEE